MGTMILHFMLQSSCLCSLMCELLFLVSCCNIFVYIMSSARERKERIVEDISNILNNANAEDLTVLAQFNKMNVSDMKVLRCLAKERSAKIQVIKPSLLRLALKAKFPTAVAPKGQVLMVYSKGIGAASVVKDFKSAQVVSCSGLLEGKALDLTQVNALSVYKSKEELMVKLIVALFAARARLALVLQSIIEGENNESSE